MITHSARKYLLIWYEREAPPLQMTSRYEFSLDSESVVNFNVYKVSESKLAKQVTWTVILSKWVPSVETAARNNDKISRNNAICNNQPNL